jgi:transposase
MELETLTELLDIPNYRVVRILQMNSEVMHLLVEPINSGTPVCSKCGIEHDVSIHSLGSITVQDINLCGRRLFLQVPKRKIRCDKDGKIRVEALDWLKGRFTNRFADEILRLTTITSYRGAGWYLDLDDETIHRMGRKKSPASPAPKPRKERVHRARLNAAPMSASL